MDLSRLSDGLSGLSALAQMPRWRLALPSALTGLVAFSFTLLIFGAATYTAMIPTMSASSSWARTVIKQFVGTASNDSEDANDKQAAADSANASAPADAKAAGRGSSAQSAGAVGSPTSIAGVTAAAVKTAQEAESKTSGSPDTNANQGSGSTGTSSPKPTTPNGGSNGGNSGTAGTSGSGSGGSGSGGQADPSIQRPSEAEENRLHEMLVSRKSALDALVGEANSCSADFTRDSLSTDTAAREQHRRKAAALAQKLWAGYVAVRDEAGITNGNRWQAAQGHLIAMYRTLAQYVECLESAWELNLAYPDPAGHEAEFTGPIEQGKGYLAEYNTAAGQLRL